MFCKSDIANLKTDISEVVGKKILVKGQKGRSKQYEKEGTIINAYSNFFNVKYENETSSTSISYTDVFTGVVDVKVYDGEHYNPLFTINDENKTKKFLFWYILK